MADGFFTYWLPGSSQSVTSYTLRYQQGVISSTTSFGFDRAGCMKMAPKHSCKWFKKMNPSKVILGSNTACAYAESRHEALMIIILRTIVLPLPARFRHPDAAVHSESTSISYLSNFYQCIIACVAKKATAGGISLRVSRRRGLSQIHEQPRTV